MADQYTRTRRLLGQNALDALRGAHVAVFGIGGVGGQAAEVLARSGVGTLTLVDSDTVALSNLNRQIVALHSTVGQYKVDVMAARIRDIDPAITVHPVRLFYHPDTVAALPLTAFSYVVDCIDTVTAKLLLAEQCRAAGVPVLSCMGAANKLDPTAFRVADIFETSGCPLARIVRAQCRKRGIDRLKVIYSTETALAPLDDPGDAENREQPAGSRRTVPASNAFVPAAEGLLAGAETVKDLLRAAGALRTETNAERALASAAKPTQR